MTHEIEHFGDQSDHSENINRLIERMESLACSYSVDYGDDTEDSFLRILPSLDLGGEIKSELHFKAERVREEHRKGVYGPVITTSYNVGGEISYLAMDYMSLPAQTREYLLSAVEYDSEDGKNPWLEALMDKDTAISIQYTFSHVIFQDGTITPRSELVIWVDEDEFPIPETHMQGAEPEDTEQVESSKEGIDMSMFEGSLDPELRILASGLTDQLRKKVTLNNPLEMFYKQISDIRFVTELDRIKMVSRTLNLIFES